jgi:hypothetical protein
MVRFGREERDSLVAIPDGLDLMPVFIESPAAVTAAQIVGIEILNCLVGCVQSLSSMKGGRDEYTRGTSGNPERFLVPGTFKRFMDRRNPLCDPP